MCQLWALHVVTKRQFFTFIFRYSEILVENRLFEPIPPLFGAPVGAEIFGVTELESWGYRMALFS